MRIVLASLAALIVSGCASTSPTSSNATDNTTAKVGANQPVTDASLPPREVPAGSPVRPLTNLPSIVLQGTSSDIKPGIAFFEPARKGIAVRIVAHDVRTTPMPAVIARGDCGKPGHTVAKLHPLIDGHSDTTLPNTTFTQFAKPGNMTVRVDQPRGGGTALCGLIIASQVPTR